MQTTGYGRIDLIINPVAGKGQPILHTISSVLNELDVMWYVHVTQEGRSAERLTHAAVEAGTELIAAYGGDGTLHQVAGALAGTDIPMCILPGGTANALAEEVDIPGELADALRFALSPEAKTKRIDVGTANDRSFLLHLSSFSNATTVDPEQKARYGWFAYLINAYRLMMNAQPVHFHLTLDSAHVEIDGLGVLVANNNAIGILGLSLAPDVRIDDGMFDVFVIDHAWEVIFSTMRSVGSATTLTQIRNHWQARAIVIEAEPQQYLFADGEPSPLLQTPATITVQQKSLRLIIPGEQQIFRE
ncbi:MAG: diacylglycerol/lipid kinase family protein [Chloroflexota bacterium]